MKIGEWVAICDDGLWVSCFDEKASFDTKREAIDDISNAKLDSRKTPKVKRLASGVYEYFPKDCDYGTFGESFIIEKITVDNIDQMKELFNQVE